MDGLIENRCPHCGGLLSEPSAAVSVDQLRRWCQQKGHHVFAGDRVKPEAAAEILDISIQTLRNQRSLGNGPRYIRAGRGRTTYRLADLAEYFITNDHEL